MAVIERSTKTRNRTGPYSKRLARGSIATNYDGRSPEGRFIRHLEAELIKHLGGSPSIAESLLVDRIIKTRMQLDVLDEKLLRGKWTDHDRRTFGALQNSFRLCLQQLGMKAAPKPEASYEELIRQYKNKNANREAAE